MDKKLTEAYRFFYEHNYIKAKKLFDLLNLSYEAGVCALMTGDFLSARTYFEKKKEICPASCFGLIILDILEGKPRNTPKYFQIRSFLEIYINLFIENKHLDWAQKVIDYCNFFTKYNIEVPKFIARVLNANNYNKAVHSFANLAREVCFFDAEIFYIDARVYIQEGNFKEAKKCINDCLAFAPEYYPILKLKESCPG